VIWYYQWILGLLMTLFLIVSFYYSIQTEKTIIHETEEYIATLSHRIKKVGEEALLEMPIGIILYNDDYVIEWANPYMNKVTDEETLVGKPLHLLSDDLLPMIQENEGEVWFAMGSYMFQTLIKKEER